MEIDARSGTPTAIDSIRFSGDAVLVAGAANVKVLRTGDTNAKVVCAKEEIPDLIAALKLAQKHWI